MAGIEIRHDIERGAVIVTKTSTNTEIRRQTAKAWACDGCVRLMVSSDETGENINDHNARFISLSKEQALHFADMIRAAADREE